MKKIGLFIFGLIILLGAYALHQHRQHHNVDTTMKRVGLLQLVSHPSLDDIAEGVIDGLAEEGYIDGETIELDFQNAEGDQNNLNTMSQTFVQKQSDIMIGLATPSVLALANSSKEIPIIMGAVTDPIHAGLMTDLANPTGNITGISDRTPIQEQLNLIRDILPEAKRLGIIYSTAEDNSVLQSEQAAEYAREIGLEPVMATISSTNDLAQVSANLVSDVEAVWVGTDNMVASAFPTLIEAADQAKIPVFPVVDTMVEQGGLATKGLNQYNLGYLTGKMAARILSGESIANTPVEFPDKLDMIINESQAKKLNITLPESVLKAAKGD